MKAWVILTAFVVLILLCGYKIGTAYERYRQVDTRLEFIKKFTCTKPQYM